ncbi:uncharacterized protein LOC143465502 isoform X2 [Clavelina lepadiformis]
MLVERERRWKKMSDVSITFSSPTSQYKHKKKVDVGRHIVIRDRNISSLMLTELQNTIDSGAAGEELVELGVRFKSAVMKGKHVCVVQWESEGIERDMDICRTLRFYAPRIRHRVIHSHVLGIVPKFFFQIDQNVEKLSELKDIFDSLDFDMDQVEMEDWNIDDNAQADDTSLAPTMATAGTKKSKMSSSGVFSVDHSAMMEKIHQKKKLGYNGNDKAVENTT